MKRILLMAFLVISGALASFVQAQTKAATPRPPAVIHSEKGIAHSPTHSFNVQLREKMVEIGKDVKSKKFTQSQAQALMEKIKAIRVQELQWMKGNPNKDLTSSQISQLTEQLNALGSNL